MAVAAIVLGALGTLAGVGGLHFSSRSAKSAEASAKAAADSARAVEMGNANALAREVELVSGGEIRERWTFIFGTTALKPRGNLPVIAKQEEQYYSTEYDNFIVACATRLRAYV